MGTQGRRLEAPGPPRRRGRNRLGCRHQVKADDDVAVAPGPHGAALLINPDQFPERIGEPLVKAIPDHDTGPHGKCEQVVCGGIHSTSVVGRAGSGGRHRVEPPPDAAGPGHCVKLETERQPQLERRGK